MYRGIEYEPMAVALSFNGSRFDESARKVPAFLHREGKTATFRVTMGGDSRPVKLSAGGGVREFTAENVTGRFDVELKLDTVLRYKGRKAKCPLVVIWPLKLQLVDPEVAATAYQKTKCTVLRAKKSGC